MKTEKIEELLQQGEGIESEFKTAQFELNKDTFDTICAFLNRRGGNLLLGVNNSGKVEGIIESCIPVLRVENLDRYDDRDDIRTNLIDSFDRLMAFVAKHLPDKFYLEGVHSISLRDRLFREIVSNLLIHREFANGFPAKMIIEKDRVYTENWSRPHGLGLIDPLNFAPFPKNPVIAKFFKEIGRMDELGSGVRNVFKYSPEYTPGGVPELIEGDIFKTVIPLKNEVDITYLSTVNWEDVRRKVRRKFVEKFVESWEKPLELIYQNQYTSAAAIAEKTGLSSRSVQKQLAKLKDMGVIKRVGADKGGHWVILYDE